jgi:hypothetical protein
MTSSTLFGDPESLCLVFSRRVPAEEWNQPDASVRTLVRYCDLQVRVRLPPAP